MQLEAILRRDCGFVAFKLRAMLLVCHCRYFSKLARWLVTWPADTYTGKCRSGRLLQTVWLSVCWWYDIRLSVRFCSTGTAIHLHRLGVCVQARPSCLPFHPAHTKTFPAPADARSGARAAFTAADALLDPILVRADLEEFRYMGKLRSGV